MPPSGYLLKERRDTSPLLALLVALSLGVEFYFLTFLFFGHLFFFWEGGGWVEAIPVTVVTLGLLDPLAI